MMDWWLRHRKTVWYVMASVNLVAFAVDLSWSSALMCLFCAGMANALGGEE